MGLSGRRYLYHPWVQLFIALRPVLDSSVICFTSAKPRIMVMFSLTTFESCFVIFTVLIRREQMDSKGLTKHRLLFSQQVHSVAQLTIFMPIQYKSYGTQLIFLVICVKFHSTMSTYLASGTIQIHFEEWFNHILSVQIILDLITFRPLQYKRNIWSVCVPL